MSRMNRRRFVQTSLAFGAGIALGGTKSSGNILGANERIRVAVAGLNGRGRSHMEEFAKMKDVEIVYVVDPDQRQFDRSMKLVEEKGGDRPQPVQNIKQVLDDPSIQAVSIATPNHWHSLMTIWACQAGKDVYVEKPMSHNVHEGRIALETARKYQRIVQHGTQSRSSGSWDNITQVARSGHYGPLKFARGVVYKRRMSIGNKTPKTPPAELDFNLWQGPAAGLDFHENLVHYNWHWFWATGNGDIGNQGVHQMDIARWGIKDATLPKSVISIGGRLGYEDQGETANTQLTVFDYGETKLIFEVRGLVEKNDITNLFHFEDGTIKADGKFYPHGSDQGESIPKMASRRGPGGGNFGNFIAAIRSRNPLDLNADILEGHYSSALCHLANISQRMGTSMPFGERPRGFVENFESDPTIAETFAALEKHLTVENGLKPSELTWQLGPKLAIDVATERFVDAPEANAHLFREYRGGYEVPAKVV